MTMSGKERHEYNQWREERARIDQREKGTAEEVRKLESCLGSG